MSFQDELLKAQAFRAQREAQLAKNSATGALQGAQAGYANASDKKTSGGLGSVLAGIGKSLGNVVDTARLATSDVVNNWRDIFAGNDIDAESSFTQQGRKKIIGGENAKERYGIAGGKALDAAATVSDLIPVAGGAKAAGSTLGKVGRKIVTGATKVAGNPLFNVVQGAASGYGGAKAEGASTEQALQSALAGGAASGVAGAVGSKVAKLNKTGRVGKLLNTQLGRGAIGGAAAGATGAGIGSALQGADLATVLANMRQGAQGGALGGGTMAGILGLGGKMAGKIGKKYGGGPVTADAIEAPTKQAIPEVENIAEAATRKIPITDYDAGTESINVRVNKTAQKPQVRGKYIDGYVAGENLPEGALRTKNGYINDIVRGKNLPEAELPTNEAMLKKLFGIENYDGDKALSEAIARGEMGESADTLAYLKEILAPEDYSAVRGNAADYWAATHDDGIFGNYSSKSELPKIDLEDYKDYIGRKGMTRADIDPELLPFLERGGRKLGSNDWGDIGLRSGEFTEDDVIDAYKRFANTDMRQRYYTNENIGGGLYTDTPLYNKVSQAVIDDSSFAKRPIDVTDGTSRTDKITVRNGAMQETPTEIPTQAEPAYTKRILNQQEQMPATKQAAQIAKAPESNLSHAQRAQLERAITENRQKLGGELIKQYGTLDSVTRRAAGRKPAQTLATLYEDYGLATPAEVQYAANHITGGDGLVSKMTRELAANADRVNTAIDNDWLQKQFQQIGLDDAEAKTVMGQVKSALARTGADGYSDGNTALDSVKQLEAQIRQYKGENNYHLMTESERKKVAVLGNLRDELEDRIWDAAGDAKSVMTPERMAELKSMYDGNGKWADFVDNKLGSAKTGKEMRRYMKPLVQGGKIVEGSELSAGSFADAVLNNTTGPSSKNLTGAIFKAAKDKLTNSGKAIQGRAAKYAEGVQSAQKQLAGEAPIAQKAGIGNKLTNAAGAPLRAAKGITKNMLDTFNNETISNKAFGGSQLGLPSLGELAQRQIGRQSGIQEAQYAQNRAELNNAANALNDAQAAYNDATAQVQAADALARQVAQREQQGPLDRIGKAMELALNAGDITAYSQLADLYKQAYEVYGTQNSNPLSDLSNAQLAEINKLDNAGNSIDELEQLFAKAGGGKGLVGGNVANFQASLGLNNDVSTYNSIAQGLINQIMAATGKTDTLNTESEVRRALQLVPQFTDTQEVAQGKLEALRQMLGNTKQTLYNNYGIAQ